MPFWRLYYHITWGTKNRLPLIDPCFERDLHKVITKKGIELGAKIYAVGGIENHIHLLASVPPKLTLSNFIGQLKGNSSHFINQVLKPDFTFFWQSEYGVVTIDEHRLGVVVKYIQNQREHHGFGTTIHLLESV
jgi:REP element-mobilizing transposase RayT